MTFDRHAILKAHYKTEIAGWNWTGIKSDAANSACELEPGIIYGSCFLGTVMSLAPSGCYTAPWGAPSTRDEAFFAALGEVADEHGMWVESGEGDPCDLFACVSVETIEA